jgi:hypothetical protein
LRETNKLFEEVSSKGAADAAILESDDFLLCFVDTVGLLDERCIDIYTETSGEQTLPGGDVILTLLYR